MAVTQAKTNAQQCFCIFQARKLISLIHIIPYTARFILWLSNQPHSERTANLQQHALANESVNCGFIPDKLSLTEWQLINYV
jgi:hypothetical protein